MTNRLKRQILAIGGGGFADDPSHLLMERYLLKQAAADIPRICFIPTASGDSQAYIDKFYSSFSQLKCIPTHAGLFRRNEYDLDKFICQQDVIYVGGGNTANMLSVWSVHGLDKALIAAYQRGIVLAGISAGAICWFQGGITDSFGKPYRLLKNGLGLLPGLFCPHLSSEPERHIILSRNVVKTSLFGYGAEDDAAIHFVDDRVSHGVCSSPYAKATQFTPCIDGFYESEIAMRDLCSQALAE